MLSNIIDFAWYGSIDLSEISNEVKRQDFKSNQENWKVVNISKTTFVKIEQLRGTMLFRISVPYHNVWYIKDGDKRLGTFEMTRENGVWKFNKNFSDIEASYLKERAIALRKNK